MSEFAQGIVNTIKNKMDESLALALIFFVGHILIAMAVVSIITGASIWEAGAVALVAVTVFLTVGVIYILRQPTDLPSLKKSDD